MSLSSRRALIGLFAAATLVPLRVTAAEPIRVFAAASLKSALDEIAAAYQSQTGERISLTYAATSLLARQIAQGAPCDLFLSADQEWMDYLAERNKLAADARVDLVGNRLVLIAPAGSKRAVELTPGVDLAALLGPNGRLAIADPEMVPAGKYAKQVMETLGAWEGVKNRLAPAENVRAALAFVARGASPLGFVYASDAVAEPAVRVVATALPGTHAPIVYPTAPIAGADARALAFLQHLQSDAAASVFRRWGFAPLSR